MASAFDLVNHVKPLGRETLGLSVGLKGNGMAFTPALAAQLPWPGGSLTEDLDYGLELARRFGVRVGYAPEARVLAQMPTTTNQAASQRARWEGGRMGLVRARALPLLGEGLRRRSLLLLDMAWDLLTPPLAELGRWPQACWGLSCSGLRRTFCRIDFLAGRRSAGGDGPDSVCPRRSVGRGSAVGGLCCSCLCAVLCCLKFALLLSRAIGTRRGAAPTNGSAPPARRFLPRTRLRPRRPRR